MINNNKGLTIIELVITLLLVIVLTGVVYNIAKIQLFNANEGGTSFEASGPVYAALELMKRDIALAGYGVLDLTSVNATKAFSLYIEDGGNNNPDYLYLFDGSFLSPDEVAKDIFAELGKTNFTIVGGQTIKVDTLDLDYKADIVNWKLSGYDASYGSNSSSPDYWNEFKGNIFQYIITDSSNPNQKVAKINSIDTTNKTLTLDRSVNGSIVGPAVFYCVDSDGSDSNCHPAGGEIEVLRKSSRNTGGRQPIASKIIDLQIAYRDRSGNWYCTDSTATCPMNPFYADNIELIRITLISRIGITDDNSTTIQAENGPIWGKDGFIYKSYTVEIKPRNNRGRL